MASHIKMWWKVILGNEAIDRAHPSDRIIFRQIMANMVLGSDTRSLILLINNKRRTINRSMKNMFGFGERKRPGHTTECDLTGDVILDQSREAVNRRMMFNNDRVVKVRHGSEGESMVEIVDEKRVGGGEVMFMQSIFESKGVVQVDNTFKKLGVRRRSIMGAKAMVDSV